MLNKKAQGMPMNVVIIAIIVLVVLVILIAFFAGGFGSVVGKVRELFSGQVSGQAKDTVIQTCQNLCDTSLSLPQGAQRNSGYCTNSFVVDHDGNTETPPVRSKCGTQAESGSPAVKTAEDEKRKIEIGSHLGIDCNVRCA